MHLLSNLKIAYTYTYQ